MTEPKSPTWLAEKVEMGRALTALYLACEESVAADLNGKVYAYTNKLEAKLQVAIEALEFLACRSDVVRAREALAAILDSKNG